MEKILVFGHKNPDTDAICSSLVMADLQTKIRGEEVISCRLGNLNEETKYALNYFKVEEPKLIEKVDEGQRVILVDHNEFTQSVEGIEKAKIEADAKKAKERAEQAAAAKTQKAPADNKQVQQKQAVPDKNNLNLYMFCNDRCWVEVTVDGEKVFEGTLVSNQEKNFSADKKIIVKYGNIKAMQIAVNGKPAPAEKVDGVVIKEYKK